MCATATSSPPRLCRRDLIPSWGQDGAGAGHGRRGERTPLAGPRQQRQLPATRVDVLPVAAGPADGPALTRAQNILIGMAQTGVLPVTSGAHNGGSGVVSPAIEGHRRWPARVPVNVGERSGRPAGCVFAVHPGSRIGGAPERTWPEVLRRGEQRRSSGSAPRCRSSRRRSAAP